MVCEHNWYFVELEDINDNYIDENKTCIARVREIRHAIFVCEMCGELKEVPILK